MFMIESCVSAINKVTILKFRNVLLKLMQDNIIIFVQCCSSCLEVSFVQV